MANLKVISFADIWSWTIVFVTMSGYILIITIWRHFHSNPSSSCWDISVQASNVSLDPSRDFTDCISSKCWLECCRFIHQKSSIQIFYKPLNIAFGMTLLPFSFKSIMLFFVHVACCVTVKTPKWRVGLQRCYHNWMLTIWHHPKGALHGHTAIWALLANPGQGEEETFKFLMTSMLLCKTFFFCEKHPDKHSNLQFASTLISFLSSHGHLRKWLPPSFIMTTTKWVTKWNLHKYKRLRGLVTVLLHTRLGEGCVFKTCWNMAYSETQQLSLAVCALQRRDYQESWHKQTGTWFVMSCNLFGSVKPFCQCREKKALGQVDTPTK